ncbi:MAG: hypothetical protein LBI30_01340 [Holosporales bacterium]|jgi:hypothetical protein|nr:hypothetical protein [Holosporales bacterium]
MSKADNNLTDTVVSRLCHDIASPIGAAKLGLEAVSSKQKSEIISAVASSLEKAITVINVFRLTASLSAFSWDQVRKTIFEYASSKNIDIKLDIATQLSDSLVKCVFIMLVILIGSSRKRCSFKIYKKFEDRFSVCLEGDGEFFLSSSDLAKLASDSEENSSKNALANYLKKIFRNSNLDYVFEELSGSKVSLIISQKQALESNTYCST